MSKKELKSKKSTILKTRSRRIFSDEFKREKVKEIVNCQYTIRSFCKLWDVSAVAVYKWLRLYSQEHKKGITMVIQKDSESQKTIELLNLVSDLERKLGQKQIFHFKKRR